MKYDRQNTSEQSNNNSMKSDHQRLTEMLEEVRAGLMSDPLNLKPYDQMMLKIKPVLKRAPEEKKEMKLQVSKLKTKVKQTGIQKEELNRIQSQLQDLKQKYESETWKWRDKEEKAWAKQRQSSGTDIYIQCDLIQPLLYENIVQEHAVQAAQMAQLLLYNESLLNKLNQMVTHNEYLSDLASKHMQAYESRQSDRESHHEHDPIKEQWEGSTIDCESLQEDMKYQPMGWIVFKEHPEEESEEILEKNCEGEDEIEEVYYSQSDESVNPEDFDLLEELPAEFKMEDNAPKDDKEDDSSLNNQLEHAEANPNLDSNSLNGDQMFMVLDLSENRPMDEADFKLNVWGGIKNFFSLIL